MIMFLNIFFYLKSSKLKTECLPGSMECIGEVLYMCDINNSWTSTLCPENTKCTVKGNQITCEKVDNFLLPDKQLEDNKDKQHNHNEEKTDKNRSDKFFILGEDISEDDNNKKKINEKKRKKDKPINNSEEEDSNEPNNKKKKKEEDSNEPNNKKKKKEEEEDSKETNNKKKKKNEEKSNEEEEPEVQNKKNSEKTKPETKDTSIHSTGDIEKLLKQLPESLKQIEADLNKKEKDSKKNKKQDHSEENTDMVKVLQTILIKDSSNFLNNKSNSHIPPKHHVDLKKITIRKVNDNGKDIKGDSGEKLKSTTSINDSNGKNTNNTSNPTPPDTMEGNQKKQGSSQKSSSSPPNQLNTSPTNTNQSQSKAQNQSKPSSTSSSPSSNKTTPPPNNGSSPPPGDQKNGNSPSKSTPSVPTESNKPPVDSSLAPPKTTPPSSPSGGGSTTPKPKSNGGGGGGDAGDFTKEKIESIVQACGLQANPEYSQAVSEGIGEIDEKQRSMFLAQLIHESAGLTAIEEIACLEGGGCADSYKDDVGLPGKDYHGRGFIQLTWGANYKAASESLGLGDQLLNTPEVVSEDPKMAMSVSVWFWNERVANDPGVQQNKFGATTNVINGPIECQGGGNDTPAKRYKIYQTVAKEVGETDLASEEGCGGGSSPQGAAPSSGGGTPPSQPAPAPSG